MLDEEILTFRCRDVVLGRNQVLKLVLEFTFEFEIMATSVQGMFK